MTARLPPYSTFRTDKTQVMVPQAVSHGNILTFTPRGFKQTVNVKFPDSRLAVCEKCKKNYKTRDSCRVRSGHTSVPWTTAYICITLDDSCTDSAGNYVDKPLTVRMINWQPYCVKEDFDSKTPVCAACKKTNRTRSFCRIRHKHRQMPWCTVFVILSTVDSTDPSTVVASPSVPAEFGHPYANMPGFSKQTVNYDHCKTDDINAIEESRTYLAKISATDSSIHWLNYNNVEGNNSGASESDVKALNNAIRTPGAGAPPPVLDANQQYYQMTQQAIHQQAYIPQPFGWSYPPPPMMQMPGIPIHSAASTTQPQESPTPPGEAPDIGMGGKESGNDGLKNEGSPNAADVYQQQAWQTQMMYQSHMYHNQMYAAQHQQYLTNRKKALNNWPELNKQDDDNSKQMYSQQDGLSYQASLPVPPPQDLSLRSDYLHEEDNQEAQDIQEVITEPEMKIQDDDFAESISSNFFNNAFPTHTEILKRNREGEGENCEAQNEINRSGDNHEIQKRARIDEENCESV